MSENDIGVINSPHLKEATLILYDISAKMPFFSIM